MWCMENKTKCRKRVRGTNGSSQGSTMRLRSVRSADLGVLSKRLCARVWECEQMPSMKSRSCKRDDAKKRSMKKLIMYIVESAKR